MTTTEQAARAVSRAPLRRDEWNAKPFHAMT